jgi:hypothetical protein
MYNNSNKLIALLKSRKFWAALMGLVVALFGERAGVDTTELTGGLAVLISYILGVALEDGLSKR